MSALNPNGEQAQPCPHMLPRQSGTTTSAHDPNDKQVTTVSDDTADKRVQSCPHSMVPQFNTKLWPGLMATSCNRAICGLMGERPFCDHFTDHTTLL